MLSSRQLAAIMFTDIEGYTAMMQRDEPDALRIKNRYREILQENHAQFNGRVIHYFGDGSLSIFQSAIEAVQCALAMQRTFQQPPNVPLRIGIHIGDVILEDEDVYGDGVNVASRIESLGVAGCVLISDRVMEEISNHPELKALSVGSYRFKNIEKRVEVFALDHEGLIKPKPYSLKGKTEEKGTLKKDRKGAISKSIAVLPFTDMSAEHDQEYFSDGMAEEIINSLAHLKDLKVAGRTSSFQFKGKNIDLREIGEKLGVKNVLEGSIRKQDNHIRVTAQLVNVEDGFHFWSEKYDRDMDDIFAIQDDIALAITKQLKITLLETDREKITKTATQNPEAYELYLKGRFNINRRGRAILTGIQFFKEAIALDTSYALAYAGYADANIFATFYNFFPGVKMANEIKLAAETSIRLDRTLCEPYCSLGTYYAFLRNRSEAKKNFIKSIELNPKYAQAHSFYGLIYLTCMEGNFQEAEEQGQIAIKLEPLSAIDHADLAWTLYTARKFNEGLTEAKTGIELDANSFLSHRLAGLCYLALKRHEEAIDTFEFLMKLSNRHQHALNSLIWALCSNGNIEGAQALMNELRTRSTTEYVGGTYAGISAAYLGDPDTAFNYLEDAFNDHDPIIIQLKYSPAVPDNLRSDPRFQSLLHKIVLGE